MRPTDTLVLAGGIALAIALGVSAHFPRAGALAAPGLAQPGSLKIGTVDPYSVAEQLLKQPEYAGPIDSAGAEWQQRVSAVDAELKELAQKLQVLSRTDPMYQQVMNEGRTKQQALQQLTQEAGASIETVKAQQLAKAYKVAVDTANRLAEQRGYTHVFASRAASRELITNNVSTTLQDMFARPLIRTSEADDFTRAVFEDLKLPEPTDEPPAAADPAAPATPPTGPGK
jgi:Skp family chaperone for outer membrane proteins